MDAINDSNYEDFLCKKQHVLNDDVYNDEDCSSEDSDNDIVTTYDDSYSDYDSGWVSLQSSGMEFYDRKRLSIIAEEQQDCEDKSNDGFIEAVNSKNDINSIAEQPNGGSENSTRGKGLCSGLIIQDIHHDQQSIENLYDAEKTDTEHASNRDNKNPIDLDPYDTDLIDSDNIESDYNAEDLIGNNCDGYYSDQFFNDKNSISGSNVADLIEDRNHSDDIERDNDSIISDVESRDLNDIDRKSIYEEKIDTVDDTSSSYLRSRELQDIDQESVNEDEDIIDNNNDSEYDDPYEDDDKILLEYKDNVQFLDLHHFFRYRLHVPIAADTCRQLWLVKDMGGITGSFVTWFLLFTGELIFWLFIIWPYCTFNSPLWGLTNGFSSMIGASLAFVAHLRTVFTNPGAVPRGNATKENISKLGLKDGQIVYKCPKCVSIKPERAHHCSVCRRCIKKMDHHCPWVNNCIGENNQKFFVLFTMYICLISCHALYMAIHHFIVCIRDDWKECTVFSPAATTIFLIFLLFEALLFGIFTAIMCGTQMSAICSDETGIEQLKKDTDINWEKKGMWLSIKAVFGHPFSYKWFSPFHHTNTGKEKLYLYNV